MSEWKEFSAKTVEEALNIALVELETTRENVEYEVIEKGSTGLLGGLPIYIAGGMSNLLWMVAGVLIGIILTFVLTYIFYKEDVKEI